MPMFAAVVAAGPAPSEPVGAPPTIDDQLVVLELGDVRLRIGPSVPPERVAALLFAALRAG